jgi:hypothetical protein
MNDQPSPFAPFQPQTPPASEAPKQPRKAREGRKARVPKPAAAPAAEAAPKAARKPRQKRGPSLAVRVGKIDSDLLIEAFATLSPSDSQLFGAIVRELSKGGKKARGRIVGALGKVFA